MFYLNQQSSSGIAALPDDSYYLTLINPPTDCVVIYSDFAMDEFSVYAFLHEKKVDYSRVYFISTEVENVSSSSVIYMNLNTLMAEQLPSNFYYLRMHDRVKEEDLNKKLLLNDNTAIYYLLKANLQAILLYANRGNDKSLPLLVDSMYDPLRKEFDRAFSTLSNTVKSYAKPDTFQMLNVIAGKPLSNKFVFSICFRNHSSKIMRCIETICKQNGSYDFGVALIDDHSDERVLDQVQELLKEHNIDHIMIYNQERKYAAKNFYNIIHHLVDCDDTFIIELDGDDYLYTDQTLDILNLAVQEGALKTRGDFVLDKGTAIQNNPFHHEKASTDFNYPRNLSKCAGWYHLRMTQRGVLRQVEIEHFLERDGSWLQYTHDASVHSRAIELSRTRMKILEDTIYAYDVSGSAHDAVELNINDELDIWEYGNYLLQDPYLFKMYVPLFEEPRFVPSPKLGEGLIQVIY